MTYDHWERFYLGLARYVSTASKDPSTKCGAAIVRANKSLESIGFNGFPAGMPDRPEWYADRNEKYDRIVHAEINAMIFSRSETLAGCTLYTYPFAPCNRCCVQMLQKGIRRFVFPKPSEDALSRWGEALMKTKRYIQEVGGTFEEFDFDGTRL